MASTIQASDLQSAVENMLREYGDVVYKATEEGLDAAEKIMINELKAASPNGKNKFAKKWKSTKKKYKLSRYVGNTTIVKGKKSDTIPLSNILEYSEKSPHQGFIKRTFEQSVDKMATAVVEEIKKGD